MARLRWPRLDPVVVRGFVVPQTGLGPLRNFVTVYEGPWGYFITKSRSKGSRVRAEARIREQYGAAPLYRINLKRKPLT